MGVCGQCIARAVFAYVAFTLLALFYYIAFALFLWPVLLHIYGPFASRILYAAVAAWAVLRISRNVKREYIEHGVWGARIAQLITLYAFLFFGLVPPVYGVPFWLWLSMIVLATSAISYSYYHYAKRFTPRSE